MKNYVSNSLIYFIGLLNLKLIDFILEKVNLYSMVNLNIFEKVKLKCEKQYGKVVKFLLIVDDDCYLEDIIFLSSQYEGLVDYNDMISTHQMIYIDKKGVIQLISSGKGINGIFMNKYLDEEEILNNIEQLVNNKAILGHFSEKEMNTVINQIKEIGNEINNNIKISVEVSKYKEDEYIIAVYISYPIKCKELVYSDLNKKIEPLRKKGIIVKCINSYKAIPLLLNITNQCYRCNHTIDPLTEYSYLCIKCKNKQYCKNCINFF